MKKTLVLLLAAMLIMTAFVACDNQGSGEDTTPTQVTEQPTEQPTEAPTVPDASEPPTTEEPTTEEPTEPGETTLNEMGLPFEIFDMVIGYSGSTPLRGYNASGRFYYDDELNCMYADEDNNMLVVTNDTMTAGTLSATFCSAPGYINDNGIIFGLEEIPTEDEEYYFWEYGPAYYFLFISDAQHLYLAKAGFNGEAWTELEVTANPVTDYIHGETNITITVTFDGNGEIKCYANGELLIDYYDSDPIQGSYYGIRCEVFGVEYYNVQATPD
ncbi:MAG: hypothetical protein IKZ16_01125 [Clostridia bacterium]|nr:hypothetical protein [Clostridia bacterium]